MNSPTPEYFARIKPEDDGFTVSLIRLESEDLLCEYNVESEDVALGHLSYILAKMGIAPQKVRIAPSKDFPSGEII